MIQSRITGSNNVDRVYGLVRDAFGFCEFMQAAAPRNV
jgi:hypothetical protein